MLYPFVLILLIICLMNSLVWAGPFQEDHYFQDVTSQAWREYDQKHKVQEPEGTVGIIDPEELASEFKNGRKWEEKRNFKRALRAYKQALSHSPEFPVAAELLWREAKCYEGLFRWVDAFNAYAELNKKYPAYEKSYQAPHEQLRMAQIIAEGKVKVVIGYATDKFNIDIARELLEKLQHQIPKSQLAGVCQFEIGKIYEKKKAYSSASEAYYNLILNYPFHPLVPKALFLSGLNASRIVRGVPYDSGAVQTALNRLNRFLNEYPENRKAPLAKKIVKEMRMLQSEKLYQTGCYYFNQGDVQAAQIYFAELKEKYPKSKMALKLVQDSNGNWQVPVEKKKSSFTAILEWLKQNAS